MSHISNTFEPRLQMALTHALHQHGIPHDLPLDRLLETHPNAEVALIKGGNVKTKAYYLETNDIKNIRGASSILDDINRTHIPALIGERSDSSSVIYAGGGVVLALTPCNIAESIVSSIESAFETQAYGAQYAVASLTVRLRDLQPDHLAATMNRLNAAMSERQHLMFHVDAPFADAELEHMAHNSHARVWRGESTICGQCRTRLADFSYTTPDQETLHVCYGCLQRTHAGFHHQNANRTAIDAYIAQTRGAPPPPPKTLEEIADQHNNIGVIYADGDNMGAFIDGLRSLDALGDFSDRCDASIRESVNIALARHAQDGKYEPIAIGGDDLFLLVPGDRALAIARDVGRSFERDMQKHYPGKNLSMSAGIVIAPYSMPVRFLFNTAQMLLKSAKKGKSGSAGMVDCIALTGDSSWGGHIAMRRRPVAFRGSSVDMILSARPLTWDMSGVFADIIATLHSEDLGNRVHEFVSVLDRRGDPYEIALWYEYTLARMSSEQRDVLRRVERMTAQLLDKGEPLRRGLFQTYADTTISIWHDISELWDAVPH